VLKILEKIAESLSSIEENVDSLRSRILEIDEKLNDLLGEKFDEIIGELGSISRWSDSSGTEEILEEIKDILAKRLPKQSRKKKK
jgi:hypothetical protein